MANRRQLQVDSREQESAHTSIALAPCLTLEKYDALVKKGTHEKSQKQTNH